MVIRGIKNLARLHQIAYVFLELELHHLIDLFDLRSQVKKPRLKVDKSNTFLHEEPETLRKVFEKLGGAFLKLGQFFALRPDLVGKEYAKEFEKLLDDVDPEEWEDIEKVLNEEIEKGTKAFKTFSKTPLASASIAQVHRATLKDGKEIVVKIKRPKIDEIFEEDISLMKYFAEKLASNEDYNFIDPVQLVEEFEAYTIKELNFTHEAKNCNHFRRNFKSNKNIKIPKVYHKYSTRDVLTLEYIEGTKALEYARTASLAKRRAAVDKITEAVFKQLFVDGFFHADLHPGNILITKQGKIALLDFGIAGYIFGDLKRRITKLFISLVQGDITATANAIQAINTSPYEPDLHVLEEGIYDSLAEYYGVELGEIPLGEVIHNSISTARRAKIKLPSQLVLFAKSLITLEGLCRELDPEFKIVQKSKDNLRKYEVGKAKPAKLIKNTLLGADNFMEFMLKLPDFSKDFKEKLTILDEKVAQIDETFNYVARVIWRVSKLIIYTTIFASTLVASSVLINNKPQFYNISIYSLIGAAVCLIMLILIFWSLKSSIKR